jgi:hypothetical protein
MDFSIPGCISISILLISDTVLRSLTQSSDHCFRYIKVDVGLVSPAHSHAYGEYLEEARCGEERWFYIQAKDSAGNNMNTNTDSFEVGGHVISEAYYLILYY